MCDRLPPSQPRPCLPGLDASGDALAVALDAVPSPARDRPQRRPANDDGAGGEFDTDIDPAWSAYTAANTAEAFPGPMTPLSLELSLEAGRRLERSAPTFCR